MEALFTVGTHETNPDMAVKAEAERGKTRRVDAC